MKRRYLIFFLLLFFPATATAAQYVVAHDATRPPFEFVDSEDQIAGYCADYIAAVGKEAGFDVVSIYIPWDGIFTRLIKGEAHIVASPVAITQKTKKSISFSDPYFVGRQRLIVPKASTVTTMADLKNTVVGVQNGTTGQSAANSHPGLTVKLYDEVREALDELVAGKLGGVIADAHVAGYFAAMPDYRSMIRFADCSVMDGTEAYGFVVKKSDKVLLQKINKGIGSVRRKGIDRELHAKWFGELESSH